VILAEFSTEEWDALVAFADAAERLEAAEVFKKARQIRFSARDSDKGEDQSIVPPEIEVEQLLHRFRPIFLQSERAHCLDIISLLGRRIPHPEVRALLKRLKHLYIHSPARMNWWLRRDETILNSDEFLTVWINAFEYHRDPTRREEFERLHGFPMAPSSLAAVLIVLVTKARVAFAIAKVIRAIETGGATRHGFSFELRREVSVSNRAHG
jgi:hypothetical protein